MTGTPPSFPLRRVLLAGEAAAILTGAYLATRLLGSPRLMRLLGRPDPAAGATPVVPEVWRPARRVAWAVERVANALPWRLPCLPRALATRSMLHRRRIPCELHLGVVTTAPLSAHAWVTSGGRVVQGGPVTRITPLATLR